MVLVCSAGVVVSGCARGPGELPEALDPELAGVFAPSGMRISPLTRLETGVDGKAELAVYFELADRWGHTVKSPGVVQVQLYRLGGVSSSLATLADRWEADLTDGARNSALFDATGMYRLPLAQLPVWLSERMAGGGERVRVRLRVFYRTVGAGGVTVDLRDTFERDF